MPKLPGSAADIPEKEVVKTNLVMIEIDGKTFMKSEVEALEIADRILMVVIGRKQNGRNRIS